MNDLDRILENQAIIMRVLMMIVGLLPSDDKDHSLDVLKMLKNASSETYKYAHRRENKTAC